MKKRLSKKTVCLGFAMIMAFSMVFTGCEKKEIKSEAQEEGTASEAAVDTSEYTLEVVYTKVDKSKLKVDKLKDLYSKNEKAVITDVISYQAVTVAEDRDGMYMAQVDSKNVNDVPGKLVDYTFYSSGKTDGVEYDTKNGVVYIPKALYDKAGDKGCDLGIQLMMAVDK